MSKPLEIKEQVMRIFDDKVRNLSQGDYREVLEEMIADLESKLDCVNEEMEDD